MLTTLIPFKNLNIKSPVDRSVNKHIYDTIVLHFKKLFKKRREAVLSFMRDVFAVVLGIRAAHLIEISFFTLDEITCLIDALRKHPSCTDLIAIHFQNCSSFICHRSLLLSLAYSLPSKSAVYWIDVSETLDIPTLLDSVPSSLLTFVESILLPFLAISPSVILNVSNLPTCVLAFTGWVLEYPVVYTQIEENDGTEWIVRRNCLGTVGLRVVRLFLGDYMLLSFSFPEGSIYESSIIEDLEHKFGERAGEPVKVNVEGVCFDFVAL